MTIQEEQDKIIEEFAILEGDQEMTNFYIMELGQKLPIMNSSDQTDENLVKGCQSKVWLKSENNDGLIRFHADSNTAITKGLVSLLVRVLSNQPANEILKAEIYFPDKIGMSRFIGTQRSNGFAAMIKQMKLEALAHSAIAEKRINVK